MRDDGERNCRAGSIHKPSSSDTDDRVFASSDKLSDGGFDRVLDYGDGFASVGSCQRDPRGDKSLRVNDSGEHFRRADIYTDRDFAVHAGARQAAVADRTPRHLVRCS